MKFALELAYPRRWSAGKHGKIPCKHRELDFSSLESLTRRVSISGYPTYLKPRTITEKVVSTMPAGKEITVSKLVKKCGLKREQVYRSLNRAQNFGYPVFHVEGARQGTYIYQPNGVEK